MKGLLTSQSPGRAYETQPEFPNGFASGYNANVGFGAPVMLTADGKIALSDNTKIDGVFAGVIYKDVDGEPRPRKSWAAGTVATNVIVTVEPVRGRLFRIEANGPLTEAARGKYASFAAIAGFNESGNAQTVLDVATLNAAAANLPVRIVDVVREVIPGLGENTWTSAKPVLLVEASVTGAIPG